MSCSSNPAVRPSTEEEIIHMVDIPSKVHPGSNLFNQEVLQSDYKNAIPADEKSSSAKSSETLPEICTNGQDDLPKATQDDLANSAIPEPVKQVTEEISDENSSTNGSVSRENRVILPTESFSSEPFPKKTESTGYCQELSQITDSPADVESSSTRDFEKELESCTDRQDGTLKSTEDELPKLIGIFQRIPKETSSGKDSVSAGSPGISLAECADWKFLHENNEPTDFIHSSLSNETGSTAKLQSLEDILDLIDARKVASRSGGYKAEQNTLGKMLSNTINSSQLNFPNFGMDPSLLTPDDIHIPHYHDAEKCMEDGDVRRFVFVNTEKFSNDHAAFSRSVPITHSFSTLDLPPVSSAAAISKEEPKRLYHEMKPSASLGINSIKTLTEMLSILENWARMGLDNAFNRSLKISSIDNEVDFKKNIQYGLDMIKDMTERIYALIKAASKLPDPYTILHRGFPPERNQIRGDLISTGITLWHTIDDIELQVIQDYKKLVLIGDTDSEKCAEIDREQEASSNIVITNACTLVTERLELLRTQLGDFREKIRMFCSEIDKRL